MKIRSSSKSSMWYRLIPFIYVDLEWVISHTWRHRPGLNLNSGLDVLTSFTLHTVYSLQNGTLMSITKMRLHPWKKISHYHRPLHRKVILVSSDRCDIFCWANTKRMGSIDDLLHSLLIRPESRRCGKCGRQKGNWRRDGRSLGEDREVARL